MLILFTVTVLAWFGMTFPKAADILSWLIMAVFICPLLCFGIGLFCWGPAFILDKAAWTWSSYINWTACTGLPFSILFCYVTMND
jgi:hypothetical protein